GEPDTIRIAPKPTPTPAPARGASRETTSAQDLRAPVKKAKPAPRDEAEPLPPPPPAERPVAKRKTTPTPGAAHPANTPRDEPPLEEIVKPTPAPKSKVSAVLPTPAYEQQTMRGRGNPDFLTLAQQLAQRSIPYNGGWTPPGESNSWVMDCSNTCRWLY